MVAQFVFVSVSGAQIWHFDVISMVTTRVQTKESCFWFVNLKVDFVFKQFSDNGSSSPSRQRLRMNPPYELYLAFSLTRNFGTRTVRHIGKREDPGDEVEVISSFCLMITCLWAAVDASAFTCVNLFSDNLTIFKPFEIRYCSVMTWCLRYKRFMFRQGFFIGRRMTLKTLRFSALANRSGTVGGHF